MIKIWGRSTSLNVQKVLWCCVELGIAFERVDWGGPFGGNDDPAYLAKNPNGRVPTIEDGDKIVWESNSILRYLVLQYDESSLLYPSEPKLRSSIDRWLDWSLTTLQPAEKPVFWALVRTPATERDANKLAADFSAVTLLWRLLDNHLQGRFFLEGEKFTLADIVIGAYAKRWFGLDGVERPPLPNLERWYSRIATRPGFKKYIDFPLT